MTRDHAAIYQLPPSLQLGQLAFSGTWTVHSQEATAGTTATIDLGFAGEDVYLVMGGTGSVAISDNGKRPPNRRRQRNSPALYPVPVVHR